MHPIRFDEAFVEISPSLATRTEFGHGGMSGSFANYRQKRRTVYESDLERKCLLCLIAQPDVIDVWEQPPEMSYPKLDGTEGTHTWDALVEKSNGTREYVYIKPLAKLIGSRRYQEFTRLAAWADPQIASSARVMSEWNLNPYDVDTAAIYNQAHRYRRPVLADWVVDTICSMGGVATVDDICQLHVAGAKAVNESSSVRFYRLMSEAYWAVIWLLANRFLSKESSGFVSTFTQVRLEMGRA